MSEQWKPAVQIWPFQDAPEEFRLLSPFGRYGYGAPESLVYVPKEMSRMLADDEWLTAMPNAFSFMVFGPKHPGQVRYAGSGFGLYIIHDLADGSKVVITSASGA